MNRRGTYASGDSMPTERPALWWDDSDRGCNYSMTHPQAFLDHRGLYRLYQYQHHVELVKDENGRCKSNS